MLGFPKWVAAGLVGGAIGAVIWATISYFTNYEIGWLAWGIGFLVGFSVRSVAGENEEGFAPGATAAVVAVLAVIAGKYAAVHMLVAGIDLPEVRIEKEAIVVAFADEIIKEREAAGKKVTLPGGKTLEDASSEADYPPAIWKEASAKWQALSAEEQQQRIQMKQAEVESNMATFVGDIRRKSFVSSFGIFDLLWLFLAAASAYKLGHGNIASDE